MSSNRLHSAARAGQLAFACALAISAPAALADTATDRSTLREEVLVTAEFRPVTLQQQAASTTVIGAAEIQQRAAQHLEEVLNIAPNVNFASGSSRARFYQIRGIGERSQFQEPVNPSVGFMIDDIDFSGLGTAGSLFDVEQVEILRGPQGTLHGANALAGLINVRSAAPSEQPLQRVEAMLADYNSWSLGAISSGPINEQLGYRVALNQYSSDGFIQNDFLDADDSNNRDELTARAKLRWQPAAGGTLDVTAMWIDIDNGYDAFSLDNTRRTLSDEPGSDTQQTLAGSLRWQRAYDALSVDALATLARSETGYSYDEDWSFVGIHPDGYSSVDEYLRDRDSYSLQLRLLSNESSALWNGRSDWVVGGYYLGNREQLARRYTFLPADFGSQFDTDTAAVFGELNTALGPNTSLITGLRVERRETRYDDSNSVAFAPSRELWGGRVLLEYHPGDALMLYGGVSRGYRGNGVNAEILASIESTDDPQEIALLSTVADYEAESLLNYELGAKGEWQTVRWRLALFYMDREDQQVDGNFVLPRADGSTAFIAFVNNAAAGENYGSELELEWQPLADLQIYASLGLLRTAFEDYVTADGRDLSGRSQAQAPNYQYALGARYDLGRGWFVRVDTDGKDDFYFSDAHDVRAPAYDQWHARLGYQRDNWSIALWGRNLTDEDVFVRGFGNFGNDPRKGYITEPYVQFGEPRLIGVSATMTF